MPSCIVVWLAPLSMLVVACELTPDVLVKNTRGQSGLWGYSVSGDVPVVLLANQRTSQ
jgi:hypothetical protein